MSIDPEHIDILVGCERSKTVRNQFRRLGFNAFSCDLQEAEGGSDNMHIVGDIRDVMMEPNWDLLVVAHPPCTRLCLSGVRWLKVPPPGRTLEEMWRELQEGADLFSDCWNADHIPHRAIENPVMHGHATRLIRNFKKANYYQPWHFGDAAFKKTGWHTSDELPLLQKTDVRLDVPTKHGDPERYKQWSAIHHAAPGKGRSNIRSKFFPGMARAVAEQWGSFITDIPIQELRANVQYF